MCVVVESKQSRQPAAIHTTVKLFSLSLTTDKVIVKSKTMLWILNFAVRNNPERIIYWCGDGNE